MALVKVDRFSKLTPSPFARSSLNSRERLGSPRSSFRQLGRRRENTCLSQVGKKKGPHRRHGPKLFSCFQCCFGDFRDAALPSCRPPSVSFLVDFLSSFGSSVRIVLTMVSVSILYRAAVRA